MMGVSIKHRACSFRRRRNGQNIMMLSTLGREDRVLIAMAAVTKTQQYHSSSGNPKRGSDPVHRLQTHHYSISCRIGVICLGTNHLVRCGRRDVQPTHSSIFKSTRQHCWPTPTVVYGQKKTKGQQLRQAQRKPSLVRSV